MRPPHLKTRGFSILENLIAVTIVALMVAMGIPSMTESIRNNRIRSMADEYSDGLRLAQQEAVTRNRTIRFEVSSAGWRVFVPGATTSLDTNLNTRTVLSAESTYRATASATTLSFNGAGRATSGVFSVDFTHATVACQSAGGTARCLRLVVAPGGAIRTCDPVVASTDPRSCPV